MRLSQISSVGRTVLLFASTGSVIALVLCILWLKVVRIDSHPFAWNVLYYITPFVFPAGRTFGPHVGPGGADETIRFVFRAVIFNGLIYAGVGLAFVGIRNLSGRLRR